MPIVFGVLGVGFFGFGLAAMLSAPAITQEMAGILLMLCGIVALGFGFVLDALGKMETALESSGAEEGLDER